MMMMMIMLLLLISTANEHRERAVGELTVFAGA